MNGSPKQPPPSDTSSGGPADFSRLVHQVSKPVTSKLLCLVPLLLLTACAGPRYGIQPVLQSEQTTVPVASDQVCVKCGKVHGKSHASHALQTNPVIESKKRYTVTVRQIQAEVQQHERPEFHLVVKNQGNVPLAFSLGNLEVQRNGNPSKTYTVDELMPERDAAAAASATAAQGVAMGMAMSAQMNASMAQMFLNNAV